MLYPIHILVIVSYAAIYLDFAPLSSSFSIILKLINENLPPIFMNTSAFTYLHRLHNKAHVRKHLAICFR